MLKKLFAAAILLAFTATASAGPIQGLTATFGLSGSADITIDEQGFIQSVFFEFLDTEKAPSALATSWARNAAVQTPSNPLSTDPLLIAGTEVFSLADQDVNYSGGLFTFIATEFRSTSATFANNAFSSNFSLIGTLSHSLNRFADTKTEFFFSSQALRYGSDGINKEASFSVTVTSPAPALISEPTTLAIFGLALVGFAASRKKKTL
jgi:hypothetical protein